MEREKSILHSLPVCQGAPGGRRSDSCVQLSNDPEEIHSTIYYTHMFIDYYFNMQLVFFKLYILCIEYS
jgi:hypothetical protein